ncbi:basic proline-rich protein-like isoform X1 [Felis catus]|uniref:basic proline-rich protein-like isoform X1 n=1 Tax=Felis catus TaxID=9685 RepID=UPI001D19BE3F|nr:basic proline-rich protein-like isoform X1 [Felis catus]XP_044899461.1 basic proline-rich protein-like isoform X1 [Felis catus]
MRPPPACGPCALPGAQLAQAAARHGAGGRWLALSGTAECAWRGRAASEGAGFPFPSSRGARPPARPMGALGGVTCSPPPPPPKRRPEPRAPPGQQPPQPPPLGRGAGDAGGRGGGGGGAGAGTGRGQSAAARIQFLCHALYCTTATKSLLRTKDTL